MKIYIASSWKNDITFIIEFLRNLGHTTYDFRESGFKWDNIDSNWESWTYEQYMKALETDIAKENYKSDMDALSNADLVIMVSPSGRSSAFELGYAKGTNKHCLIYMLEDTRPDLMFREVKFVSNLQQLQYYLDSISD